VRGYRNARQSEHSAQFTLMIYSETLIPFYFEDKWITGMKIKGNHHQK